ncbi:hypothetical protein S7S_00240 [Isoalcanivorax pacificus W11-5]|uniref:DUF2914 domain-containing protein n=1 Tax=Isoalcanivorax pacificus W11-5 TaxID=391936 RepID=A0A0B4XJA2_9GAMM|nr:DUF5924 family protein [Isoalcanivorax pacificus]AJD46472.1 hypothetical protein S7S_00240 [Isoalcanivorax pacificus W11-5]
MQRLKSLILWLIDMARRHPGLIALFGFVSGVASLVLVERKESLAQMIAILMLVSWVWLTLENVLRRGIAARFGVQLPPPVLAFLTQMVHQESLFFVLPFFMLATTWDSGQLVFTGLLMAAALISVVDPLYYKWLARRRWQYLAFHSLTLFAVLLTALPILLHLTTAESYKLATLITAVLSFPSLAQTVPLGRWWRAPLVGLMMLSLGALVYLVHTWIPPATLRLTEVAVTTELNNGERTPGERLARLDSATLRNNGLFAYTAIRAPRGLNERIYHVWYQDGAEVDRIPLDIRGGRQQGYRAWTHKRNFPAAPAGRWRVRVITEGGQLIGVLRFQVTP